MQGEVAQTIGELMMYFTGLIERRRAEPEDDTVSHLVAAGVGADGDISGTLQILGFAFTMVTGATIRPPECWAAQYNCYIRTPPSARN